VLDEAAQSLQVSSMMPILLAKKCILAGDHKQLPPTVKSKEADALGFSETLFKQLADRLEAESKPA
jgi:ATP-dependent RNA/DNA helicase IGHMBP2